MFDANKIVLITGATGRQGGGVIRHLLPKGWSLRALTRNPNSGAAKDLIDQGIEVFQGDLEDPSSLESAVRGAYGIYSVQDFWAVGAKREVQQGKNLADAAKKSGVEHFVFSSVGGAERNSGIDHWESKWEIEKHIRKLGLPATMIRPVAFMENYYVDQVEIGILKPRFSAACSASRLNSGSCRCRWFVWFWARSSTRCSAGSTRQGSKPTSLACVVVTPRSACKRWRSGSVTKVGTNVRVMFGHRRDDS